MTGIDYPTITVGDKTLTVKFSLYTQYLLSRAGIDLRAPIAPGDPKYLSHRLEVFAAAVADNYKPGEAPAAEAWARTIGLDQWGDLERAIGTAMGKAAEELRKGLAVVPPAQESQAS